MDDQKTPQAGGAADPAAGGAQPVSSDTSLPWMNFAPDASITEDSAAAGSTPPAGDTGTTPAASNTSTSDSGTFDPFGNPFASDASVASAFAPSPADGSMTAPAASEPAVFTPSEPSAFTPTEPSAFTAPEAPAATSLPDFSASATPASAPAAASDTSFAWSADAGSAGENDDSSDSLTMLQALKKRFDEEEEEFNHQIEEHNANIQYEKEAINKLRSERSARITEIRNVVRDLEEMLGIKKEQRNAPKEETRKAERIAPKKQSSSEGVNDFLSA